MSFKTADLYDAHGDEMQVVEPLLRHFGVCKRFCGRICTLKVHEDNMVVVLGSIFAGWATAKAPASESSVRSAWLPPDASGSPPKAAGTTRLATRRETAPR